MFRVGHRGEASDDAGTIGGSRETVRGRPSGRIAAEIQARREADEPWPNGAASR